MDLPYISDHGWQITPPPGWHSTSNQKYQVQRYGEPAVRDIEFRRKDGNTYLEFSWGIIRTTISARIDSRLWYILWNKEPNLKEQVRDLLKSVAPVLGEIKEVQVVSFSDGYRGLELIDEWLEGTGKKKKAYTVLFPVQPPRVKPYTEMRAMAAEEFSDPVTSSLRLLYPERYKLYPKGSAGSVMYVGVGHEKVQRLYFSANAETFDKWVGEVKKAFHSFHYKASQKPVPETSQQSNIW
ncbi:MAG: hypothetical protein K8F91_26545 [Candidatus Obscuribacterales bacterium]|nr:hypothetical protein [Candidatus Obscuribacterales bacterium]